MCVEHGCNSEPEGRNKRCYKCLNDRYRINNPFNYSYLRLKANAKYRKKEFDLTLEEVKEFARETNYMKGKGRNKYSLHIDRIDETKGYTKGNLQVLPNADNVKKYIKWVDRVNGKSIFKTFVQEPLDLGDNDPF